MVPFQDMFSLSNTIWSGKNNFPYLKVLAVALKYIQISVSTVVYLIRVVQTYGVLKATKIYGLLKPKSSC